MEAPDTGPAGTAPHPDRPPADRTPDRIVRAFSAFCTRERERRADSGEPFDAPLFEQAMDLVLQRLETTESRLPNDHQPSVGREPAPQRTA